MQSHRALTKTFIFKQKLLSTPNFCTIVYNNEQSNNFSINNSLCLVSQLWNETFMSLHCKQTAISCINMSDMCPQTRKNEQNKKTIHPLDFSNLCFYSQSGVS